MTAGSPQKITVNYRNYDGVELRILALHSEYLCGRSGMCCADAWGIKVFENERKAILAAFERSEDEAPAPGTIFHDFVKEDGAMTYTFARNEEGACTFLGGKPGETCCKLQMQHGGSVLPLICQSFPRAAVAMPGGVFMSLSYACPTAQKTLLSEGLLHETRPGRVYEGNPKMGGAVFGEDAPVPEFAQGCKPEWRSFNYFWRWAVEWVANPALTPSQALYGLGLVIAEVERQGAPMAQEHHLIDVLDQLSKIDPEEVRKAAGAGEGAAQLGVIYLETIIKLMSQIPTPPHRVHGLWKRLVESGYSCSREDLIADYQRLILPTINDYELIERNWVGSRLFANPMCYQAPRLRTAYFTVVLSRVVWRMTALAICLETGKPLSQEILLEAAGLVDYLFLHNLDMRKILIDTLEPNIHTDIRNLALPAMA